MPDSTPKSDSLSIGSSASVAAAAVEPARPQRVSKPADARGWWWGTGRRKTAVARVRLRPAKSGPGSITLLGPVGKPKTVEQYFAELRDRVDAVAALTTTGTDGRFEIHAKMHGGGFMGQAQALRLGIARALIAYDATTYDALRGAGLLTRDAREVERKKYGQAGARRRFQFSKR